MYRMNYGNERMSTPINGMPIRFAFLRRTIVFGLLSLFVGAGVFVPAPAHAQGGVSQIFLPILSGPPVVSNVLFNSSLDCGNENFTELTVSPTVYGYGIEQLGWGVLVKGGSGYSYRVEWTIDGAVVPGLARSGVVEDESDVVSGTLFFGQGECGGELPRGTYTVRLFLNESLQSEGTVTIQ